MDVKETMDDTKETEIIKNGFTREYDLDHSDKPLVLYQCEVGDVSCVVWDAALVLASYLQKLACDNKDYFKDRKILELGAGIGCVGLTAASLGGIVTLTDLPEALPLLERNISANEDVWKDGGSANALSLKWGCEEKYQEPVDILLLADCVYYTESVCPLVTTIRNVCRKHTEVFICQEQRPSEKQKAIWIDFMNLLTQYFTLTAIHPNQQHPRFRSEDIMLFKAKLKQD